MDARAGPGAERHRVEPERSAQRGEHQDRQAAAQGHQGDGGGHVVLARLRQRLHGRDRRRPADGEAGGDQQRPRGGDAQGPAEQERAREGGDDDADHHREALPAERDQRRQGQLQAQQHDRGAQQAPAREGGARGQRRALEAGVRDEQPRTTATVVGPRPGTSREVAKAAAVAPAAASRPGARRRADAAAPTDGVLTPAAGAGSAPRAAARRRGPRPARRPSTRAGEERAPTALGTQEVAGEGPREGGHDPDEDRRGRGGTAPAAGQQQRRDPRESAQDDQRRDAEEQGVHADTLDARPVRSR